MLRIRSRFRERWGAYTSSGTKLNSGSEGRRQGIAVVGIVEWLIFSRRVGGVVAVCIFHVKDTRMMCTWRHSAFLVSSGISYVM
jgi:hypothetical protein